MKELERENRISEKIQIESVIKKKKQSEYKFDSTIKPKSKSHSVWEINIKTLSISKAKFVRKKVMKWEDAVKMMNGTYKDDIVKNKDCVYISALNKKSALDRYKKNKGSALLSDGIGINLDYI